MKFIVEIDATIPEMNNITFKKTIESESPANLLEALALTNGTANGVPTLSELLIHLFEKRCAYAGRNYTIFVK